jgi:hypothetical protein
MWRQVRDRHSGAVAAAAAAGVGLWCLYHTVGIAQQDCLTEAVAAATLHLLSLLIDSSAAATIVLPVLSGCAGSGAWGSQGDGFGGEGGGEEEDEDLRAAIAASLGMDPGPCPGPSTSRGPGTGGGRDCKRLP